MLNVCVTSWNPRTGTKEAGIGAELPTHIDAHVEVYAETANTIEPLVFSNCPR